MRLLTEVEKDLLKLASQTIKSNKIDFINLTSVMSVICVLLFASREIIPFYSITLAIIPFMTATLLGGVSFYFYYMIYRNDYKNVNKIKFTFSMMKEIGRGFGMFPIMSLIVVCGLFDVVPLIIDSIIGTEAVSEPKEPSPIIQNIAISIIIALLVIMPLFLGLLNAATFNLVLIIASKSIHLIGINGGAFISFVYRDYKSPIIKLSIVVGFIMYFTIRYTDFGFMAHAITIPFNAFFLVIIMMHMLGERPKKEEKVKSFDFAMQM